MSVNSDWELLFDHHNILDAIAHDGHFMITSMQINAVHEARLMTKFDNRSNLPPIFSGNGLSILPTNRGGYIIGRFDAYNDVPYRDIASTPIDLTGELESKNLTPLLFSLSHRFFKRT